MSPGATDQQGGLSLGVLASGSGTVLESILAAGLFVTVVLADRECRALDVAQNAAVPVELIERASFGPGFDRDGYTERVVKALAPYKLDVLAMAGFGTILGPALIQEYPGRVLNTHPALLPAFKGWHAVKDALDAGATVTGTTVHVATREVDGGPVLAQQQVPVLPGDTEQSLHERIKSVERQLYPRTIKKFMAELSSRYGHRQGGLA